MAFVFTCPETGLVFNSGEVTIGDNRGVQTDADGNRFLDARVKLNRPCPRCGGIHTYAARELACPYSGETP